MTIDIADSKNKADINIANVDLVEFGVYNKSLLANNVQEIYRRWAVEDYTKNNKINVIILLIMNLGVKNINYIEDSLLICHFQVAKFDNPNINNIIIINEDVISLWQDIICWSNQLPKEKIVTNCI